MHKEPLETNTGDWSDVMQSGKTLRRLCAAFWTRWRTEIHGNFSTGKWKTKFMQAVDANIYKSSRRHIWESSVLIMSLTANTVHIFLLKWNSRRFWPWRHGHRGWDYYIHCLSNCQFKWTDSQHCVILWPVCTNTFPSHVYHFPAIYRATSFTIALHSH